LFSVLLQLTFQNLVFILCQMTAKLCHHNLDNSELRYPNAENSSDIHTHNSFTILCLFCLFQIGRLRLLLAKNGVTNPYENLESLPTIYAITPTHTRPLQKAELTRFVITLIICYVYFIRLFLPCFLTEYLRRFFLFQISIGSLLRIQKQKLL
jgi:hypothetical protein